MAKTLTEDETLRIIGIVFGAFLIQFIIIQHLLEYFGFIPLPKGSKLFLLFLGIGILAVNYSRK